VPNCSSNSEVEDNFSGFRLSCSSCRPVCKLAFDSFSASSLLGSSLYLSEVYVLIEKHWRNQWVLRYCRSFAGLS